VSATGPSPCGSRPCSVHTFQAGSDHVESETSPAQPSSALLMHTGSCFLHCLHHHRVAETATATNIITACLAGVKAVCVHLCLVTGNTV